jgi:hypothetical protein
VFLFEGRWTECNQRFHDRIQFESGGQKCQIKSCRLLAKKKASKRVSHFFFVAAYNLIGEYKQAAQDCIEELSRIQHAADEVAAPYLNKHLGFA